ncbi:MAG: dodecin domain-containing protein [Oligoflexia bacterium]|nr:dodecin domain-containing protein [Oligoflexia bacterium]MBF0367746.1 dodecin domain-containing protein [Oligoflexia bacterium]
MLRMLELTGSSPIGYSEAAATVIQKLMEAGENVHFFKVEEMRGSVRNGKIEFQVVIKVALE